MRIWTIAFAAAALAASPPAGAQEEAAGSQLDDASVIAPAQASLAPDDDADNDMQNDLAGAQAANGPLAFGVVTANGGKFSGTPNFSSSFNPSFNRYEISIAGHNYHYLGYATVITAAGDNAFCRSSSVGGRLLVFCHNASGQAQPGRFGFVTFRH